jgi:chemotaxis family two-component system sensor kinase Cph1
VENTVKILIVEDQAMISFLLEDVVVSMGHEIIGPAVNGRQALALAEQGGFDGALVDYNLEAGSTSYEAAVVMIQAGIPFVFLSGCGETSDCPELQNVPLITKPFLLTDIEAVIEGFQS